MILVVIATAGFVFARLTAPAEVKQVVVEKERDPNAPIDVIRAKVYVTLSGGAKTVGLFANAGFYRFGESEKGVYSGDLKIAKDNPVLEVKVDWLEEGKTRHFAKVVVEAEGQETFTHVFDAEGDIYDFVELPF